MCSRPLGARNTKQPPSVLVTLIPLWTLRIGAILCHPGAYNLEPCINTIGGGDNPNRILSHYDPQFLFAHLFLKLSKSSQKKNHIVKQSQNNTLSWPIFFSPSILPPIWVQFKKEFAVAISGLKISEYDLRSVNYWLVFSLSFFSFIIFYSQSSYAFLSSRIDPFLLSKVELVHFLSKRSLRCFGVQHASDCCFCCCWGYR